jgi:hypothetical protein
LAKLQWLAIIALKFVVLARVVVRQYYGCCGQRHAATGVLSQALL